ncbi:unnamed protein product, partial [Ectocarpus sp. 12 AP-2014]
MRQAITIIPFIFALAVSLAVGATAQPLAKDLFGAKQDGSPHLSEPFGFYSKGCLAGGMQLPETGPTWQAMRLSRNRNWGHADMIDYLQNLSAFAAKQPGWQGLYIGDISQPRGGPMISGHRSHQMGLDADVWMLPASRLNLSRSERESLSSISVTTANEAYVNSNWTTQHFNILREAAQDRRVERIFVSAGIKVQMCKQETGNRRWLQKVRPIGYHNYHFHVRLECPRGASGCVTQDAPPRGDGCDEAQQWVNNIINPPKRTPGDPN